MMRSDPRRACSASGRSSPWVSEMTPMRIAVPSEKTSQRFYESLARCSPESSFAYLRCHCHPPRVDTIQRLPQHARRVLGRIQGRARGFGMSADTLFKLLTPHVRMVDIRRGMQGEIAAGLVVGAIHFPQTALLLLGNARHLRLVGIESRQRIFRRACAGYLTKMRDQLPNLRHRTMPLQIASRSHALCKVQP